jgi:hypothetical protein
VHVALLGLCDGAFEPGPRLGKRAGARQADADLVQADA